MYDDARLGAGLNAMMQAFEVPSVSLANIRRKIARPAQAAARAGSFYWVGSAAAVAISLVAMPVVAPAFVQSLEAQIEAVLHWTPPAPPPDSIVSALRSNAGTLSQAQTRVKFVVVPPAGLPKDLASETIATMPGALFSASTHAWSVGRENVWFTYRRASGATFTLMAAAFDPRDGAPSKYVFEDESERDGRAILVRHDKFLWRNGDQVMTAITSDGLSAAEILAIRSAMHGTPIAGVWPPRHRSVQRMYLKP
jgi:hypothetical protein